MSDVVYEEDTIIDPEEEDIPETVSDLEFRDMVKRTYVDLLLCIYNLWKSSQVIHEDFKEIMGRVKSLDELTDKLNRVHAKVCQKPSKNEKDDPKLKMLIYGGLGGMAGMLIVQIVTLIAVFTR